MSRVLLVDDEPINLSIMEKMLSRYPQFDEIEGCTDSIRAYENLCRSRPDVVFLDIEMPGMNGLELAGRILEHDAAIQVVFVTAYDYYAIEAFELYALDYLLKPINPDRLDRTVSRMAARTQEADRQTSRRNLTIRTFGGLEVMKGSRSVAWQGALTEELFAFLVSHYNGSVHKDVIVETLWPSFDYRRGLGNMQTAMYRVRRCLSELGAPVRIDYNSNCYRLILKDTDLDLRDFESVYGGSAVVSPQNLAGVLEAVALYRRPWLEGNGYLWAYAKQMALEKEFKALLTRLVSYYALRKEYTKAMKLMVQVQHNEQTNQSIADLVSYIEHNMNRRKNMGNTTA